MVPSSPPSQGTLPWLGYTLVCIVLTILGAYALFYYCPQPFLDPRHPTSEIGSTLRRLFQNQEAVPPPKAMDNRVSSLNNEIQKLHMRLDVVTKRKEDIEDIMIEREAEYRGRQFRLEETWSRAREELQESSRHVIAHALAEQAKEIASLRTGLEAMRNECKWRDDLIWSLSLEKDGQDATIKQYEWETSELRGPLARMNAKCATNEHRILTWQEEKRGFKGHGTNLSERWSSSLTNFPNVTPVSQSRILSIS
ncbi:hypothetical protein FA13DRAFT_1787741 [Coprinellus micaceus]|uniref:Uncharacterized protein n=1 Tax=Coprinellus micaceus TaxID=71717 RepID=A0A4Y7TQ22_COPMI|nr:hypothetical protein FA13DRAFT_1787741 [Coprinellus micaceus]